MGLLDLFKKKKQEEVQTTIQQTPVIEERELTEEEEKIWEFAKAMDKKIWEKVSYNENNFVKLPDYQEYVNKYHDSLSEVKAVAQRMIEEKKSWSLLTYSYSGLENQLMDAYKEKLRLKVDGDFYEWLEDINGNYKQAEMIMNTRKLQKQAEDFEKWQTEFHNDLAKQRAEREAREHEKFIRIMEKERTRKLDMVFGSLIRVGMYDRSSYKEFMALPKEELDELIEIQETAEEIIKNNPAELTGTKYSGQGKEVKDIFLEVKYAKRLMKGSGTTGTLYNYICNQIVELEKIYKEKEQEVATKVEEMAQNEEINNELTDEVKRGL